MTNRHAQSVILRAIAVAVVLIPAKQRSAFPQQLDATERAIVSYVDAHIDEAIGLLERVVNINSGTMNLEGVAAVGRVFGMELDALGFTTEWIDMSAVHRGGHLFAEVKGGGGKRVLLIGHLDTVFEKDSPFQRFERADSIATGPGVEDMKGGDVVLLYALKALQAAGAIEGANIIVALTGDEENTGDPLSVGRAALLDAGRRSDVALGFEGGVGTIGTATVARRGFTGWEVRVGGIRAHSSQIFREDLGAGAIYEAARILSQFYEEMRGERYLTFNPGTILGGTAVEYDAMRSRGSAFGKTNVIAETTVIAGDLRTISIEQRERAKARMREIVDQHLPHTSAEIGFRDSYPAMEPTEANYALLQQLDRVSRDLGFGTVAPVDPGQRGAADVSFVAPIVEASLDGLGPVGGGGHTTAERVSLDTIGIMAKRAAVLIYRLTRSDAGTTRPDSSHTSRSPR